MIMPHDDYYYYEVCVYLCLNASASVNSFHLILILDENLTDDVFCD